GHRPRIDRCAACGRPYPFPQAGLDVEAGGLVCGGCRPGADTIPLSTAAVRTLKRFRELRWDDTLRLPLAPALEGEVCAVVEGMIARLAGQVPRSARFLAQMRRSLSRVAEPAPPGSHRCPCYPEIHATHDGHARFSLQAARLRLPVERDLRRHRRPLGRRAAG